MHRHILLNSHILWIGVSILVWGLYILCGIPCPIAYFLGVPCPTCGVTRALFALLQGDFQGYLHYHALAVLLIFTVLLAFHIKAISKPKIKIVMIVMISAALFLNLLYYIIRLQMGFHL